MLSRIYSCYVCNAIQTSNRITEERQCLFKLYHPVLLRHKKLLLFEYLHANFYFSLLSSKQNLISNPPRWQQEFVFTEIVK
jgi:hypothetical protein